MSGTLSLPTTGTFSGLTEQTYINAALAALANLNAGASAPTTGSTGLSATAGLLWHDTANNLLKLRNQADTAWIVLGAVDETNGAFYPAIEMIPGGRLTLASATPVLTADETAKATIYYDAYAHDHLPIWNGTLFVLWRFAELSLALDSNSGDTDYHAGGSLFDVFAFNNSGTLTLGTGPAWSSTSARSAAIALKNGIWTNNAIITLRFGSSSGNTVSVAANEATYLGTFYATANGQTGMAFQPAAANGGTNNFLALWNAYNRVPVTARSADNTSSWTSSNGAWHEADNSASNRISWIDGLAQSFVRASYLAFEGGGTGFAGGLSFNSTSAAPSTWAQLDSVTGSVFSEVVGNPILGLSYAQALESCNGSVTVSGNPPATLTIDLEM